MKILIIRVSAIGDVIHTLPAIFYLKQQIADVKINWVVQQKAASLLIDQPFIDNLYILPNKFLKMKNWGKTKKVITELRENNFDAIIDFQGLIKTSLIISLLKGKKFGFDKNNAREKLSTFFTNHKTVPVYKNIIQKNLSIASSVISDLIPNTKSCPSIEKLKDSFSFFVSDKNKKTVDDWLEKNRLNKFVTLSPNTTWPSKHWPPDHWKKFLYDLKDLDKNLEIVLLGKNFGDQALKLSEFVTQKNIDIKIAPDFDLSKVAYLIKKTDLLIAPDTGILHLADFLGTKTIGLFGPTLASKHGPFLNHENIKNAIQIECPHLYKKNHGTYDCMKNLLPNQLLKTVLCSINN